MTEREERALAREERENAQELQLSQTTTNANKTNNNNNDNNANAKNNNNTNNGSGDSEYTDGSAETSGADEDEVSVMGRSGEERTKSWKLNSRTKPWENYTRTDLYGRMVEMKEEMKGMKIDLNAAEKKVTKLENEKEKLVAKVVEVEAELKEKKDSLFLKEKELGFEKAKSKNQIEAEKSLRLNKELSLMKKIVELQGTIDSNPNQVQALRAQADVYKKEFNTHISRSQKFDQIATIQKMADIAVDKERSKLAIR